MRSPGVAPGALADDVLHRVGLPAVGAGWVVPETKRGLRVAADQGVAASQLVDQHFLRAATRVEFPPGGLGVQ